MAPSPGCPIRTMSFLSPIAALFALALPVVVIFYLLKRKRVVKLVSRDRKSVV